MSHAPLVSTLDVTGAVLLTLWAVVMWLAVGVLAFAGRGTTVRPWLRPLAIGLLALGVVGQAGHLQEHVAQAGYWIAHPNAPSWMTPWGDGLARGMGQVDPSKATLGMEILHLVGNLIFLAGLVGVALVTRDATRHPTSRKWAKMGVWMQGIHGLEHLSLTLSVAFGAQRAIGLSTWFGTLEPGAGLTTYRVWWHFVANVVGSVIFGLALYHLWREHRSAAAVPDGGGGAAGREAEREPAPLGTEVCTCGRSESPDGSPVLAGPAT
ncbi:DUF6008 family protein [Streptomyces sp. NPDC092296]|uniref:DUF6008 family protein n=1 Tax=Streptomyces sp. NPDC092296 TaxID=3366012 RepID=UPI0038306B05